jgi:hypothetical protein
MPRKKKSDTQWEQPTTPPPPLFTGKKEKDFVKQVNDELIERVIGQQIAYFAIDIDRSPFHPIYGEAIQKTFLPPVRVHALIKWEGQTNLFTDTLGIDKQTSFEVHFHKRRLTEDQNLFVREGDYVLYGDRYYEIVSTAEPKQLFGQAESRFEVVAKCIRAREGVFNPQFTANTVPTKQITTSTATPTYGGNGIVRPNGGGGGAGINGVFNSLSVSGLSTLNGGANVSGTLNVSGSILLNGQSITALSSSAITNKTILITSSYTVQSDDYFIGVDTNYTGITVTLPTIASTANGRILHIKDEKGFADIRLVTISASSGNFVDEVTHVVIDTDHGAVSLYKSSTGWNLF